MHYAIARDFDGERHYWTGIEGGYSGDLQDAELFTRDDIALAANEAIVPVRRVLTLAEDEF